MQARRIITPTALDPQATLEFGQQRRGIEERRVVPCRESAAGDAIVGRAIDVDAVHLARLRLAAVAGRDAVDDLVDEALLDGEVAEPAGQ